MYCSKCGWNNPDDAAKCSNCQADLQQPTQPQPTQMGETPQPQQYGPQPYVDVPNFLAWSIVLTVVSFLTTCLLGCLSLVPLGFAIAAIVKSAQANNRKAIGDFGGAMREAESAKLWLYWSAGAWAVSVVIGIILQFVLAAPLIRWIQQMSRGVPR